MSLLTVLLLVLAAFVGADSSATTSIPDISTFISDWTPYRRGLGHDANSTAPLHGLALPIVQNTLGSCIADENVMALRSCTVPPFSQGPYSTVARNVSRLARLSVIPFGVDVTEAKVSQTSPRVSTSSEPVYVDAYQWTPWSARRRGHTHSRSVTVETEMAMPLFESGVVLRASVSGAASVDVELFAQVRAYGVEQVNCTQDQWRFPFNMQLVCWNWYSPRPFANQSSAFAVSYDADTRVALFHDVESDALTAIGLSEAPSSFQPPRAAGQPLTVRFTASETAATVTAAHRRAQPPSTIQVGLAIAMGTMGEMQDLVDRVRRWSVNVSDIIDQQCRAERTERFLAAFSTNNSYFSGHLPTLTRSSAALHNSSDYAAWLHYYGSILQTLDLERHNLPAAPSTSNSKNNSVRRVWLTGAAENATTNTFFWDVDYAPTTIVMLDPAVVRATLLLWLQPTVGTVDNTSGWGVDWITGHRVGAWYAANDFTLFIACHHYVSVTADFAFLKERISGLTVQQWMRRLALAWQNRTEDGVLSMADYGGAHHLLECVPSYIHEVAGINAANVWMMEALAHLCDAQGTHEEAAALRHNASALAHAILSLYVPGQGVWRALYPNGTSEVVRHVVDLVYTSRWLQGYLSPDIQTEMSAFAQRELLTPHWMRALSFSDKFANFSDRTDHGPNGAYPGWVALTMAALARAGSWDVATALLTDTARVVSLGPYGQALSTVPMDPAKLHGYGIVPYKPFEFTLFSEFCGLSFAESIITVFFGLHTANASLAAAAPPPVFAPEQTRPLGRQAALTLHNLAWQGALYQVSLTAEHAGPQWRRQPEQEQK